MIARILVALFLVALLVFGVIWIMSGGLSRAISYASTISSPLELFTGTQSGEPFRLPGQPNFDTYGPDVSQVAGSELENAIYDSNLGGATEISQQNDPQSYGNPSANSGSVTLALGQVGTAPAAEYLVVSADSANTAPISLGGWSLQSVYTGVRHTLPQAAASFTQGVVNAVQPVLLEPGGSVVVSSGVSPVGVSFRENACTGFLSQFQPFSPPLQTRCVRATDALPDTAQARAAYGDSCFDFLSSLPSCTFPQTLPASLQPSCVQALREALTYNSCMRGNRNAPGFWGTDWRLYFASPTPLWREHDVVRLLDPAGRVVDVLSY